jgi:UrcA family protein
MTNLKTAFSHMLAPALLLAIATAAMPAGADALDAPLSITIKYSDLDVTHEAGVKALYGRIQNAAHTVCEPQSNARDLQTMIARNKCISNAVSNAMETVGLPALTSLYQEKTGKVLTTRLAALQIR